MSKKEVKNKYIILGGHEEISPAKDGELPQVKTYRAGDTIELTEKRAKNKIFANKLKSTFIGSSVYAKKEENKIEDIKKDLSENLTSLLDILKEFTKSMPDKKKEKFENDYLKMSPYCLTNLNNLLEGLEWTKIYLNELKRK